MYCRAGLERDVEKLKKYDTCTIGTWDADIIGTDRARREKRKL